MSVFWISTENFTVGIEALNNTIVKAPPIVSKFIGQPVENLLKWCSLQREFKSFRWEASSEQ